MSQDPLIGKTLANFRVERVLGRGGMAIVYAGIDTQLERPVAIKLINAQFQGNPEYASRFVAEAKLVARWRHENIIAVYYADVEDDLYYYVMEFIDGAPLSDLLLRYLHDGELMPHEDVLKIARAVADGLDYAHKQQVVHRDIKPANIMISRDDRVVLTDFGLALDMNMGSMGQIFGTPHYVAPEQVRRSSDANPQSDIYSFGIVLYEILTGSLPFDDPSATALAMQHLSEPPPKPRYLNPELNQATEDVLLKTLAKEPSDRYETATDLVDALADALKSLEEEKQTSPAIMPPAAISQQDESKQPRVSRVSITDMLEMELNAQSVTSIPKRTKKIEDRTAKPPEPVAVPEKPKSNNTVMFVAGGVIAVVIIGFLMFGGSNNNGESVAAVDLAATTEALAQAETEQAQPLTVVDTATIAPPTQAPATSAPTEPQITLLPTDDLSATEAFATEIQVTNDAIATNNAQLERLLTETQVVATEQAQAVVQTQQAIQATQNAVPTEAFPSGRLLELTYNSGGFYLRNSSDSRVRDSRLSFVAINASGAIVSDTFNGSEWARFYNFIDSSGRCVAIELLDQSSWNRPTNCVSASGSQFNSQLTFDENDNRVFWTGRNGATQFVVLWDDSAVATCDISAGYCPVRIGT